MTDTCTHNHTLQPPIWERHFDKAFERASGSHDHSFYTDLFSSYDTQLHLRTCYSRLSFGFGKKRLRRHTEVQYLYSIQDVQHRAPEKERKGTLPSAIKNLGYVSVLLLEFLIIRTISTTLLHFKYAMP